jgi:putative DNA methylase
MTYRKKLIEVALPLEAINMESAREKSIRHGHPSTLHLWWARRPLAACRAVLWSSLVDDPSSWPDRFPTEEAQKKERQRLFDILGRITIETDRKGNQKQVVRGLVSWNDINDQKSGVLEAAQREIARCLAWDRGEEPPTKPNVVRKYIAKYAPPAYDPFAGGGSIPLEAQRLGLEAHASDLNPVAVLINKALIEIPPKFKDQPPVNPEDRKRKGLASWKGAQGLAADVRYYGQWMRDDAFKRIGHLYPKVELPKEYGGGESTVIAWLWARMVKCPNPACGCQMPLVRSFQLSTKKGKEAWVEPVIDRLQTPPQVKFQVKTGKGIAPEGTVERKGAQCVACGTPVTLEYVRTEGRAGRMSQQLMTIVAEGLKGRIYLPPKRAHVELAESAEPIWKPDADLPHNPRDFKTPNYGMKKLSDLFTSRQLVALTTFSDLVGDARGKATQDAIATGLPDDGVPLNEGGTGARAYGDAIATYLGMALSKLADASTSLVRWKPSMDQAIATFGRQAIPMVWDYAESNIFNGAAGDYLTTLTNMLRVVQEQITDNQGQVSQHDATSTHANDTTPKLISTDPPYYDNIGYADLSDFFYVWLRRSVGCIYPSICSTLLVPKTQELVATPYRFDGSKQKAQIFFENGLGKTFNRIHEISHSNYPLTVYYAFKQAETDQKGKSDESIASTGWETMLEGLVKADFSIGGTWPMRSELSNRMIACGTNALASSIVLVCRPRPLDASKITRRQFLAELKRQLPTALKTLQQGNIAPVDLAQSSIGPGMAIFSQYAAVLENDGSPMRVRTALQLINQILDEFLTEQEGEFDGDTRWALTWFEQYQFDLGQYGDAETLSKAKNTSVQGMVDAGILEAKGGKVRLLKRDELKSDWNPASDSRMPDWEIVQYLIHELDQKGELGAAALRAKLGDRAEAARDLAYRLYSLCDKKGWTQEAIAYNSLVISWPEITRLASEVKQSMPVQQNLGF